MKLVLLGAPGVGKGTQSARMVKEWGLKHISTGDILRQAVANKTPLGVQAKAYMDAGDLVPDFIVIGLVKSGIAEVAGSGFILDGFPRNISQAEVLDKELADIGITLDRAISIDVDQEIVVKRLTSRRACEACGRITSMNEGDKCSACGGRLVQREDDNEQTVRNRLEVYNRSTAPLIGYFRDKGILTEIDGSKSPDDVWVDIRTSLGR
ncbi:MAG: adenylate kinase [Actinobacteria bacterium]|nr:adenylate kinase [Actinomycetota bacterium]MCL5887167.1 adenylate kinase [Actinomycetota bacterium]